MNAELCGDEQDEWWLYLDRDGLAFTIKLTPGIAATMIDWVLTPPANGYAFRVLPCGSTLAMTATLCTLITYYAGERDAVFLFDRADTQICIEASVGTGEGCP